MRKITYSLFIILFICSAFVSNVRADGPDPVLVNGTTPVSTEIRDAINVWLATSAPYDAPYYAVTYVQPGVEKTLVSLVALNISDPDQEWHFVEEGNTPSAVVWIGSVEVHPNGDVYPFSSNAQANGRGVVHRAVPRLSGGGAYVAFPWQAGKGVVYGKRGIHGSGDYGTSGMVAVDLLSGTDLGSGAANDKVYAADAGEIDYVCNDGTSVAVRTYNSSTGDYFLYAHLLNNANLTIGTSFSRGQSFGSLKHGSFNDSSTTCGWAEQASNHWHVHWMFTPSGGAFRAEDCILETSDSKWHCGATQVIGTGGWLLGGGGTGSTGSTGTHDPGRTTTNLESSLWDNILVAVAFIIDPFWKVVPQHQGLSFIEPIYRTMELVFRLLRVFAYGNINLGPVLALLFIAMGIRAVFFLVWLAAFALKAWKSLVPILGA